MPRTRSKSSAASAWCETEAPTVTHGGTPPERSEGMTASSASMHPLDGWLADLIERTARETAETDRTKDRREGPRCTTRPRRRSAVQRGASCAATRLRQAGRLAQCASVQDVQGAKPGLCQPWAEDRAALVLAALGCRGMDQGAPAWGKGERRMTALSVQTPDNENARRYERRAFSSAAIFSGRAVSKLAPDPKAIKAALADPERVLGLLGLLDGAKRQAHGFLIRFARGTPSARRRAL
jgi:hypothetical protein